MSSTTIDPPIPGDALSGDVFGSVLAGMSGELHRAVDVPVFALDDARLKTRLSDALRVKAGVEELIARLVSEVDDRDLPVKTGASSTRAFLQATHRMSRPLAGGLCAQAKAVSERTETTRKAWAAGAISGEQAVVIARAIDKLNPATDPARAQAAQTDLVAHAQILNYTQLQQAANHLVEVFDPDGADATLACQLQAEEARALQATMFRGSYGADGIARFSGRLPNLQFAMLTKALQACAAPRRASAATTGGRGAGVSPVLDVDGDGSDAAVGGPLTYPQRLGRALIELIEHLPVDNLPQHGVANATIVVTIDSDTMTTGLGQGVLDTGQPLSAAQARRLACNAGLLPLVLGGNSQILDLGNTARLFDRHQRLALAVRDNGCIWPGCDRPPAWCEAHHITPWSQGGPTDLTNGCLLCSFHHHLVHKDEWAVTMATDGTPQIIPPPTIDPQQEPLRHIRFKKRRPG